MNPNNPTRQPDLTVLAALLLYNTTLPDRALDAAARGDFDLAKAWLRLAQQRGVQCARVAEQVAEMERGLPNGAESGSIEDS